uniref:Uncharacterized protein n=1 Tax=Manihot esculenta TaxID=3983 RepID=A0A2C9VJY7_MANES
MGMKMTSIGIIMLIMACTSRSTELTGCAKQCMPSCLQQTQASADTCAKACSDSCNAVGGSSASAKHATDAFAFGESEVAVDGLKPGNQ